MRRSLRVVVVTSVVLVGLGMAPPAKVDVDGSDIKFDATISMEVDGAKVSMDCTGTGLREKYWVNVYAIASYVKSGEKVKGARGLVSSDAAKMMHLTLEREVAGDDMVAALNDAIAANYPDQFATELGKFKRYFEPKTLKAGAHVKFIHRPGKGVRCEITGYDALEIDAKKFSQAIWDIWLGAENVGDEIKDGLTSRLK